MRSQSLIEHHLGWSNKQSRILTADGLADTFFTLERGFSFIPQDIPHYHLQHSDTRLLFRKWSLDQVSNPICGAWNRALFMGGFEHSSSDTELVYNVQTNSLFVDLRIPTSRCLVLPPDCTSLASLSDDELRCFARQHVFGGYSRITTEQHRPVCTRHHCIDWNYVGVSRSRPNKWWIEINSSRNVWKEWAYAKDDLGQHYYMERWERCYQGESDSCRLALRKREGNDGIVVVVGDHFNYLFDRKLCGNNRTYGATSIVDLVDAAIASGDRTTAETFCSIDAGHGRLSNKWIIDCSIQPWKEGSTLWRTLAVEGLTLDDCWILLNGDIWDIVECSFDSIDDLKNIFR